MDDNIISSSCDFSIDFEDEIMEQLTVSSQVTTRASISKYLIIKNLRNAGRKGPDAPSNRGSN